MSFTEPRSIHPCLIYEMDENTYEKKWKPDRYGEKTHTFQITTKGDSKKEYPFYNEDNSIDIKITNNKTKESFEYSSLHLIELMTSYSIIGWDYDFCLEAFGLGNTHLHTLTGKEANAVLKFLSFIHNEEIWSDPTRNKHFKDAHIEIVKGEKKKKKKKGFRDL